MALFAYAITLAPQKLVSFPHPEMPQPSPLLYSEDIGTEWRTLALPSMTVSWQTRAHTAATSQPNDRRFWRRFELTRDVGDATEGLLRCPANLFEDPYLFFNTNRHL